MPQPRVPPCTPPAPGCRFRRHGARGLSAVESLVAAAIVSTLVAVATASLAPMRNQWALTSAAAEFETDVQFARSLALLRQQTVRVRLPSPGEGRCWIVHTGARDACRCHPAGVAECAGDAEVLRQAPVDRTLPLRLEANVRSIAFDPQHGTATPAATVRFSAPDGRAVHQVIGIMGRVRSCTPSPPLPGYRPC